MPNNLSEARIFLARASNRLFWRGVLYEWSGDKQSVHQVAVAVTLLLEKCREIELEMQDAH